MNHFLISKNNKYFVQKLLIGIVFFVIHTFGFSQDNTTTTSQDTIKKGYDIGRIEVPNPKSIVEAYTYDPIRDRYILTHSFDGFNVTYPLVLTPEEFKSLVLKEKMRKYFQEKSAAADGKGTDEAKKNLLPRYYINSKFFEAIFGSNTIDLKPSGSVEVDLGVRFSKQDNPAISPNNRKSTTFDFDQRISMSLQGKIGTRLQVDINYDTQSTFAFQNLVKLSFQPGAFGKAGDYLNKAKQLKGMNASQLKDAALGQIPKKYSEGDDSIIKNIEIGNVSFPLNSTLIKGAQSLFGAKTELQFGKTTVSAIFSEQKSQTRTVTAQGGGTIQDFELFALDYDSDRHFFLSQYFRNQYDKALENYPYINTQVQITRLEVWVTNKQNRITATDNNFRNIIALQDLGEARQTGFSDTKIVGINTVLNPTFFSVATDTPSANANNKFDPNQIGLAGSFLNNGIRDIATANTGFNITGAIVEGVDYAKLENARKLQASEYTFNPQLGYVSLNQRLANDEVLAVAYQYTIGNQVYQVGEFATDGVASTNTSTNANNVVIPETKSLVLKMLKSTLTKIDEPIWNLLMKNIYQIPGGYQLEKDDFRFNILYTDPSPINYINAVNGTTLPVGVANTPLIKVFHLDKLNATNDPQPGGDGFFDFIQGLTIDAQNGRIIFTKVEPFGKYLFERLKTPASAENYDGDPTNINDYNLNQKKYVFRSMYQKTQAAALQEAEKNKFQLKGKYKSSGGDGIPIGAFNVPQGSVVVTAGGRQLIEGLDYTVNYQMGKVQILDPSLQASNTPIQVSVENNAVFGQQTKRFWGVNVEHKLNKKLMLGTTFLNFSERPFTSKSNYGQESVNNSIIGFNANYATEIPFFTRLVNKLPTMDTDVPSMFSFRGEIAYLKPGASKADQFNGEPTIYIDDFEGSQNTIDMRSANSWTLSSAPYEIATTSTDIETGYKRAKLSWYSIDPVFYTTKPNGIDDTMLSNNRTRRIFIDEIFPNTTIAQGQQQVINTFDLTYTPTERGQYNFSPIANGNTLPNPQNNWAGIMRSINFTNFEQSNVEYVQFWMLNPYSGNSGINANNTGILELNLGEISEDILRDGRKMYENGLPESGSLTPPTLPTVWGNVPAAQSLIYAFDTNPANRTAQDLGYDGLTDAEEKAKFAQFASLSDPANDNYQFYLTATGDVINRYKNYNGFQGNAPVEITNNNRGNTTLPDVEDVNRDNTMNTIDQYFKFEIPINNNPQVGQNYVADIKTLTTNELPDGTTTQAQWVLYKIPIQDALNNPANIVNGISDFRSIRFMRLITKGFQNEITLRFASFDLVRGEWRRFAQQFDPITDPTITDNTGFDVTSLNIQENQNRSPIRYVSPPGVEREQLYNQNSVINQNEQSLSLRVYSLDGDPAGGLERDDARAVFKNVNVDMRQYKKLRMFLHAEALPASSPQNPNGETNPIADNDMTAFIRIGNDFTQNYYQIEVPLKVTPQNGNNTPYAVWPSENEIELPLEFLTKLKILKLQNSSLIQYNNLNDPLMGYINESALGSSNNKMNIAIKGNPNFGLVRTIMLGVRNNSTNRVVRGEVWFNELRMSDMDNKGGMAAVANMDTNFADLANVSATGRMSTIGFGSIEQGANERSREDVFQYDVVTNLQIGKLLPTKWKMTIPFNYGVGEEIITPEYDPFNQDLKLQQLLDITENQNDKEFYKNRAIEYTKRKSINFIGVKKDFGEKARQDFFDPENFTLNYSYNQTNHTDYEIEDLIDQQVKAGFDYAYSFTTKPIEPLKKSKLLGKTKYLDLLKEINFNYLPSNISFSSNMLRNYNRQQFRNVDIVGLPLDPLYRRNYIFNYQYGFNFNITKSLKLNYTSSRNNIVRNYLDQFGYADPENTIWTDFFEIGTPNQHNQSLTVNYEIPIHKIPALSFIKSSYTYTGNYNWQRASDAFATIIGTDGLTYSLGNTIQNANTHNLNTNLTMETFYKYIGLTKKLKGQGNNIPKTPVAPPKPGEKITQKSKNLIPERSDFMNGLIGFATSIKNIQINYAETNGTVLPGYLPNLGFWGTSRPTLGFVIGSQSDIRYEAAKNGWLTSFPTFNQSVTQVNTKNLKITARMELFPEFSIDINADRTIAHNYSEQYNVTNGNYTALSPFNTGNFQISTVLIKTAFSQSDENFSDAFQTFRNNRIVIANRLAEQYYGANIPRYGDAADPNPTHPFHIANTGYPIGFGRNSQDVMLPAFLAAYQGQDITKAKTGMFRDIPLPNWTLKYTGFMRYEFFKDIFKRFSIQHGYRASYNLNAFRSNLEYATGKRDNQGEGNYLPKTIVSNINITEQFNPLARLDFEMNNSIKVLAEVKKDRTLNLSLDNSMLTEVKGNDYTFGLGYRIKDVKIGSKFAGNAQGILSSDINIKADVTLRKNKTIVRQLEFNNNQLAAGQDMWSIKLTADYAFSKSLTALFYYDHQFTKAVISTAFPTTNIRSGFTLRYSFGN